ncbi:DUF397 domain-containing protein [Streptomyces sp. NRRL B-24572]|uniref:DUF397 domain-containing protein n=1 Tax=Streptomyces sp. NRRL B-24572 TaxID=1962156 RepID=UPI000A3AA05B|nr:DUF397 domain-containing protein [Streptomyces sp. NRRL B-24572]
MTPEIVSAFRKSSFSDQQGDCVEMAHTSTEGSAVRDSKAPAGPHLCFEADAWASFVDAVKAERL